MDYLDAIFIRFCFRIQVWYAHMRVKGEGHRSIVKFEFYADEFHTDWGLGSDFGGLGDTSMLVIGYVHVDNFVDLWIRIKF